MLTYRFYTRAQDVQSLEQCFVSLDLTRSDFQSIPRLDYYVKHWFIDVDDLIDFLLSRNHQRITLIVSQLFADITCHVLRSIFPQISRIIIIGEHRRTYENVEYFDNIQSLVDQLSFVLRNRKRIYITYDLWPVERTSLDLNKHTGKFIWYNYFYTILSHLKHTDAARTEMLSNVRVFHRKQTDTVQKTCEEFQRSYNSMDIIKWYTRESFFYLLLNRTLRSEDINHIFTMRYVISDLEIYLRNNYYQDSSIDIVYRGQQMYLYEIQEIEANIGGLIGLTAFWSASRSATIARNFIEIWPSDRTDPVENILFSIKIPSHVKQAVYLDISQFSTTDHELEILFSFRSVFRVEHATKTRNDNFWHIDLILIDNNDEQFVSIMHQWYSSSTITNIISHRSFYTAQTVESKANFFRNLTVDNGPFLGFQLLVDIMLRLDQNEFSRQEFLEVCRESCSNDSSELEKIDEFERNYVPRDAIKLYTKGCFVYRLINRSLRSESIDLIFKLRYVIHDLHNQLAEIQPEYLRPLLQTKQYMLRLYRGLTMSFAELQKLQQNEGNLVSTNTFLSTTGDYEAAVFFAGDGNVSDGLVSVVYEIDVDLTVNHSIPFAKIDYLSIYKDEDEVLFSIGAVFRVGETKKLKDRLWKVYLMLTSTEDEQWNVLTNHLNSMRSN